MSICLNGHKGEKPIRLAVQPAAIGRNGKPIQMRCPSENAESSSSRYFLLKTSLNHIQDSLRFHVESSQAIR